MDASSWENVLTMSLLDNYTRIKNDVIEAMCSFGLSGGEFSLCLFIIRKTWGFNKKEDWVSYSQLEKGTGMSRVGVWKTIRSLKEKSIILVNHSLPSKPKYKFNKNYLKWTSKPQLTSKLQLTSKPQLTGGLTTVNTDSKPQLTHKRKYKRNYTKESIKTFNTFEGYKQTIDEFEKEAEIWLEHFRKVRKAPRYRKTNMFIQNFVKWRETYTVDEMREAVSRAKLDPWMNKAITPTLIFRTRHKNGSCDYMGDLLNKKIKQ